MNKFFSKASLKKKTLIFLAAFLGAAVISGCDSINNGGEDQPASVLTIVDSETEETATTFGKGTKYGDLSIAGMTIEEGQAAIEDYIKQEYKDVNITVTYNGSSLDINGEDIEIVHNYDLYTNLQEIIGKRNKTLEPSYTVQASASVQSALKNFRSETKVDGGNATVSGFDSDTGTFTFVDGQKGSTLIYNDTLDKINEMLVNKESGSFEAPYKETESEMTAQELSEKWQQLGSYSTVSTNTDNGNHNMALALEKINGTVLQPGEVFSFNDTVGDSTTAESGFLPANGIMGGIYVQMYGGGICQASSTLYMACLYSGLQIEYRTCHSSPSSYVPIGLDATVDYGNLDYKFSNNLDYPIYIRSYMEGVTLYVSIYGVQPDWYDSIEVTSWTEQYLDPLTTISYSVDYSLSQGTVEYRSSASYGYVAKAQRTYYKDGYVVEEEALSDSTYPATGTIYAVGPGTDTSNLDHGYESTNNDDEYEIEYTPDYNDYGSDDSYDYGGGDDYAVY